MQDKARFFAYSTWAIMISLGVIIFTHAFFQFMGETVWITLAISAAFGVIYFNLTFAAIKRYIKKVPAPTNMHVFLSLLIFLPPLVWILTINETSPESTLILILMLILSAITGTIYGNKAGIKARYEYIQKIKELQKSAGN